MLEQTGDVGQEVQEPLWRRRPAAAHGPSLRQLIAGKRASLGNRSRADPKRDSPPIDVEGLSLVVDTLLD